MINKMKLKLEVFLKDRPLVWSFIFVICICAGFLNRVVYNPEDYYELYSAPTRKTNLDFNFTDVSHLIGVRPYHKESFRNSDSSHVIIGDIDRDQYEDFISIGRNEKGKNFFNIYKNVEGKRFEIQKDLMRPVWNEVGKERIYTATLTDLDNDQWPDLVIVQQKNKVQQVTFFKNVNGEFNSNIWAPVVTEGDKRNINLVDVNADGFIDLYFSSFLQDRMTSLTPLISNGSDGGKNILLLNIQGKKFEDYTDQYNLGNRGLSWTAAIGDFNQDGFPDIVDINDFGYNAFKFNHEGKYFKDVTKESYQAENVSYSMSGEVADFNNDGLFDIFISNVNRPTLFSGNNFLLINDPKSKGRFRNLASKEHVDACGWAWGAKAFEPMRDGNEAIIVVNAPTRSPNSALRSSFNSAPIFLKEALINGDDTLFAKGHFNNLTKFPERNCVFVKSEDSYIDVAHQVGIRDEKGGKSVGEIDFNNDGVSDFIIGNVDSNPILYQGTYSGPNNWIGFELVGKKSNSDAIGAVIKVNFDKRSKIKQIFPTNGYQSQSTKKIVFGIKKGEKLSNIQIMWPSRNVQTVTNFNLGQYNRIEEYVQY